MGSKRSQACLGGCSSLRAMLTPPAPMVPPTMDPKMAPILTTFKQSVGERRRAPGATLWPHPSSPIPSQAGQVVSRCAWLLPASPLAGPLGCSACSDAPMFQEMGCSSPPGRHHTFMATPTLEAPSGMRVAQQGSGGGKPCYPFDLGRNDFPAEPISSLHL